MYERPAPPYSGGKRIPSIPIFPSFFMMSLGNCWVSSRWKATGAISFSAKRRTVWRVSSCSSLSWKSNDDPRERCVERTILVQRGSPIKRGHRSGRHPCQLQGRRSRGGPAEGRRGEAEEDQSLQRRGWGADRTRSDEGPRLLLSPADSSSGHPSPGRCLFL